MRGIADPCADEHDLCAKMDCSGSPHGLLWHMALPILHGKPAMASSQKSCAHETVKEVAVGECSIVDFLHVCLQKVKAHEAFHEADTGQAHETIPIANELVK